MAGADPVPRRRTTLRSLPDRVLLAGSLPLLLPGCAGKPPEPTLAEQALTIAALFETSQPYAKRTVNSLEFAAFFEKYPGYRSDSASVADFYRRRGMQFAWIVSDSLSASAEAFVTLAGVAITGDDRAAAQGPSLRELYEAAFAEKAPVPLCDSCASTWNCASRPSSFALPTGITMAI
jgi:hypothetical protein